MLLAAPNDHLSVAGHQGVSSEALHTAADGPVTPDLAVGVLAAGADTRVLTVVVEAGQAGGPLGVILAVALPIEINSVEDSIKDP